MTDILVQNRWQGVALSLSSNFLQLSKLISALDEEAEFVSYGLDIECFRFLHEIQEDVRIVGLNEPLSKQKTVEKHLSTMRVQLSTCLEL